MRSISAEWVVPVKGPPIRDARVVWEGARIVEVGPGRGEEHHDASVIFPGFVNAHSHLEYAVYAGFGDGQAFGPWIGTHVGRKRTLDRDAMRAIARCGVADSLASGISTTADYSFSGAAAHAAEELGLRAIVYLEVFASDPKEAERQFDTTRTTVAESDLVRVGISPHAPYTCSLDVYRYSLSLGLPVGTHLAESPNEEEWLLEGGGPLARSGAPLVPPTGKTAVHTLEAVLGPELLCAHCVTVSPDEIALLAARDVPIAHCPRSNALLGCGIAPLAELRAAGLRVGLGTDSPASTPSFDMFEELRTAVYLARARALDPEALSATDALRLATTDAARVLRMDAQVGTLTPGKRADIAILSLAGSPYHPVEDPAAAIVFGGSPERVVETIVDGETRHRRGTSQWQEVRSIANAARQRMLSPVP